VVIWEISRGSNKGKYPAVVIREISLGSNKEKYPAEVIRGNTPQK